MRSLRRLGVHRELAAQMCSLWRKERGTEREKPYICTTKQMLCRIAMNRNIVGSLGDKESTKK